MIDALLRTTVFTTLVGFIQSLWAETNGRIFLTTFIAYAASYMIYSGYISWFAGGYGGLLLTQVGFSIIDLLGLLPMAFVLLFESLWPLAKAVGKFVLLYIILPFALLVTMSSAMQAWNIRVFPGDAALGIIGIFLWTIGLSIGIGVRGLKEYKWIYWLPIILCYGGVILAGLTTPFAPISAIKATTAPFQTTQDLVNSVLFEGVALIALVTIPMVPLLIGRSMAAHAVKGKLLSRVQKLVLKQAFEIPGALPVEKPAKKKKASSEEKDGMVSYHWEKEQPIYLVASLSKTTALYVPPETIGAEKGRLVLLANDLICSMEI